MSIYLSIYLSILRHREVNICTPSTNPSETPTESPSESPTEIFTESPTNPKCEGDLFTQTKLNFDDAKVEPNPTLHKNYKNSDDMGKVVYNNIGYVKGVPVKLEVTVNENTHYVHGNPGDYKDGGYGYIRIQKSILPKWDGRANGQGNFKFCFKDNNDDLVKIDSFYWTVLDLEMSANAKLRDQVIINMDQVESYSLVKNSQVEAICEDTKAKGPCKNGDGRTIFQATEIGEVGSDPTDPMKLTPVQQKQSVAFEFRNKRCFSMVFKTLCNEDKDCNDESSRKFAFTGEANGFWPPECKLNLNPTEYMLSTNGLVRLRYGIDGNLVLVKRSSNDDPWSEGTTLWSTNTNGNGNGVAGKATMMGNGNLVVRHANSSVLWSSNTASPENWNSELELKNNGDLVIVNPKGDAVWSVGER